MPEHDFRSQRLFVEPELCAGASVTLPPEQAHYVAHVIRLAVDETILLFNGRDGEWRARRVASGKRDTVLEVEAQVRLQPAPILLEYAFAPLKHARLDYMVQKAVEMGAGILSPVITRHTQVTRVNGERMRANAIEAAEQCGIKAARSLTLDSPRGKITFSDANNAQMEHIYLVEIVKGADGKLSEKLIEALPPGDDLPGCKVN